jgi:hypothetical protein
MRLRENDERELTFLCLSKILCNSFFLAHLLKTVFLSTTLASLAKRKYFPFGANKR